ncbi:hypothetical protein [Pseudofrankia sp. DC12]|uniref:hypothetical protein n=1 Tax=Pseudofrankia sp. DC12 TaxID=683315 RepID=UPI0005F7819E
MRHEGKTEARLERIRGSAVPRRHNARTIAALTSNPGCGRRAVLDAAGVDKDGLADRVGYPAGFGQSPFAIVRGNVFEKQVKADGAAELLRLLRDQLGLDLSSATYRDLGASSDVVAGGGALGEGGLDARHAASVAALTQAAGDAASGPVSGGAVFDHPLLRLDVAGQEVSLEPDLVVAQPGGVFHIVEIKSFPVIDGQADGEKVAAAAIQAAVYVLALRRLLGRAQAVAHEAVAHEAVAHEAVAHEAVAHEVVLVCPKDFSNTPVVTKVDIRRQLLILEHQLARLTRIDSLLDALPDDLRLDLAVDASGAPRLDASTLTRALGQIAARYAPGCLSTCELAFFCRHESTGRTATLGVGVREELGGVETVADALALAHGTRAPDDDQAEAAAMLRTTARVYAEVLAGLPAPPQRQPAQDGESRHPPADELAAGGSSARGGARPAATRLAASDAPGQPANGAQDRAGAARDDG